MPAVKKVTGNGAVCRAEQVLILAACRNWPLEREASMFQTKSHGDSTCYHFHARIECKMRRAKKRALEEECNEIKERREEVHHQGSQGCRRGFPRVLKSSGPSQSIMSSSGSGGDQRRAPHRELVMNGRIKSNTSRRHGQPQPLRRRRRREASVFVLQYKLELLFFDSEEEERRIADERGEREREREKWARRRSDD